MGSNQDWKHSVMVCAPITTQQSVSVEQIANDMYQAKAEDADIVEVRLDCITNFHPPKWEGGLYEGDENMQLEALQLAVELGADFIEVQLKAASCLPTLVEHKRNHNSHGKIIVSCYVDGIIPPQEELLQLVPLIAYSVGERGLISQLLSQKFGGFFVYESLAGNPIPGLPSLDNIQEAYKLEHVKADTKVFGLISKPISHSKGPILHNPPFRHINYNGIYVPMFVDDLKEFFNTYPCPDFSGFIVGIPYKEEILRFCDEVHPLAQRTSQFNRLNGKPVTSPETLKNQSIAEPVEIGQTGAVNTIIRRARHGKLVGYNTHCEAAITAIEDALIDRAKSLACAVFGEAQPFKELVNFQPEKEAILANATPVGMLPNTDRIPVAERLVFDAVYRLRRTRLLKEADAAGAITVGGVEMFLRQAIGQFNLFTGLEAPEEFMREIVLSKF
ncbi:Bifunctional 3-dehydroquinate dehydratase/shikimate dehydrogenase, chloroplastic [Glycine max]|nr:Bifunctional 3-dehydroquinate dehydratase/shikimate dehydrogenase, chloroplastic [Glycine max]